MRRDAPEPSSGWRAGCAALALAPIPPASRLPTPPCPSPSASLPRSAPSSSSVSRREAACRCIRAPSRLLPVMLTSRNYSLAFDNLFFGHSPVRVIALLPLSSRPRATFRVHGGGGGGDRGKKGGGSGVVFGGFRGGGFPILHFYKIPWSRFRARSYCASLTRKELALVLWTLAMPLADQLCHRTISWSLPFLPDDFNLNSYRVSHLKVRPLVSLPSGGSHISTCPSFSGFHFPFLLLDPTFRQFLCATKFLILNLISISSLALAQT